MTGKKPKPANEVFRAAILAALRREELSTPEIAERLGMLPPGGRPTLGHWLRNMEHKGLIKRVGLKPGRRVTAAIVWSAA